MSDTFHFGNVSGPVNAGSGNLNVGSGNQVVSGGDLNIVGSVGSDPAAAEQIEALRQMVAGLRLSAAERERAERALDGLAEATDKKAAAGHLERLVAGLKKADAVASDASSFAASVTKLVQWIGPLAAGVLAFL